MKTKILLALILALFLGGCVAEKAKNENNPTAVKPTPGVVAVTPKPGSPEEVPELEKDLENLNPDEDFPTFSDQDLGL